MPVTPYAYLEPLVACIALGVIVLICRWVFAVPSRPVPVAAAPRDFGLLEQVTVVRTREDADLLCEVLRDEGIRATATPVEDGLAVLVFRADARRARNLVSS